MCKHFQEIDSVKHVSSKYQFYEGEREVQRENTRNRNQGGGNAPTVGCQPPQGMKRRSKWRKLVPVCEKDITSYLMLVVFFNKDKNERAASIRIVSVV